MAGRLDSVHLDVVRTANAAVRAAASSSPGARSFLCECGDAECVRSVALTPAQYDDRRLAADPRVLHAACAAREDGRPRDSRCRLAVALGARLLRGLRRSATP